VSVGGPVRGGVPSRRRASGIRNRPAMFWTRAAASVARIPAAVTNTGRTEVPRRTAMAWVAMRKADLAKPITGMAKLGVRVRAQTEPAIWIEVDVSIDHQQAQPGYAVQHVAQRPKLRR